MCTENSSEEKFESSGANEEHMHKYERQPYKLISLKYIQFIMENL